MSETHPRNWTLEESIAHLDAEHWNKPCTWADAVPADAQCARCGELFDGTESFEAHFEAGERQARKAIASENPEDWDLNAGEEPGA